MEIGTTVQVWTHGCLVEGHKGLVECTPTSIQVRRRGGRIHIQGTDLVVASLTRSEVWVRGNVQVVAWRE